MPTPHRADASAETPDDGASAPTTRDRILAAAERCFVAEGLAVGTRAIAKAAGVTQPLILHYFASKESLFRETIDRALGRLAERQAATFALPVEDHLGFVITGLDALIRITLEDPALLRLATWARLADMLPVTEASAAYWRTVGARLAAAQKRGVVRDDLPLELLLPLIDATIKGAIERAPLYARAVPDESVLPPERIARGVLAFLVPAVLTPAAVRAARARFAERLIK